MVQNWKQEDILLNKYKIKHCLAPGSLGQSYKIQHIDWDIPLRLKVLKDDSFHHFLQRWMSLKCFYGVVNAYCLDKLDSQLYLITEYIEGQNLREYIENETIDDYRAVVDIAIQIMQALKKTEKYSFFHNNLKYENVFVVEGNQIHISDFLGSTSSLESIKQSVCFLSSFLYGNELDQTTTSIENTRPWKAPDSLQKFMEKCLAVVKNNETICYREITSTLKSIYEQGEKCYCYPIESSQFEIETCNKQAFSYIEMGHKEKATQLWLSAMNATPASVSAKWNWHLLQLRRGIESLEQFIGMVNELIEQDILRLSCAKALLALEMGAFLEESLEGISQVRNQIKSTPEILRIEGELLFCLGNFQKAADIFSQLVEQKDCEGDDWYRLAAAYFEANNHEKALEIWEKGYQEHPNHVLLYIGKAVSTFKQGNIEETRDLLVKITEKYPHSRWPNLHAGEFFSGKGIYERSVSDEEKQSGKE